MKNHYDDIILEYLSKKYDSFLLENENKYKKHISDDQIISPELKIKHKDTGVLYTVDSISKKDVVIRDPEGGKINILHHDLEDKFELA